MGNVVNISSSDVVLHCLTPITVEVLATLGIEMAFVFAAVEVVMPIQVVRFGAIQDRGIPCDGLSKWDVW
jgi:hypothetical protein